MTNYSLSRINRTKQKIHRSLNGGGERIFTVGRLFSFGFEPFDERSDGFFYASWSPSEDHQFVCAHQTGAQEKGDEINAWFDVFYFQRMALTE